MPKTGRPKKAALVLTDDERNTLRRLTKRARVNRSLAFRARLVLACADGTLNRTVARRYRTTDATVGKWRQRFIDRRLEGIYDEPRAGAPRTIADEDVEALMVKTLETTPTGETHWSTRTMAANAGMSHTTVGRIWRTFGLKPHLTESFKISPDPQLIEKVRDVVGLYMNPPTNAAVFAFDEKSQIQALERAQPILPMDIGQPERRTHNYIRNGTLDLFAALNVATGEVLARCKSRHRAADFVAFLRDRCKRRAGAGDSRGAGQSLRASRPRGAPLAAASPTLPSAFHADLRLLAQSRRTVLRDAHRESVAAWIPYQRGGIASRDPRVRCRAQREGQAVQVDEDRRRDPRQNAAIRPAYSTGACSVTGLLSVITDPGD